MTDWGVPEDDDINPLGPAPTGPDSEPETERGDVAETFTDGTGSVTLQVDEDGVIVGMLINNNWRNSGKGQELEALISSAALPLYAAQTTMAGSDMHHPVMPEIDARRLLEANYFDEGQLQRLVDGLNELGEPVDADAPGYRDQIDFTPATGESTNRKITVTLGMGKVIESCTIDSEWSSGARAEKIAQSFMEAHDRALAQYTEPVVIPGRGRERVQFAQDMSQLALDLLAGRNVRHPEGLQ